jgi:demethylmenaquinone methyltransferase/2-methoxy-6-polyprenyl-1,4-benzoquinol methylase
MRRVLRPGGLVVILDFSTPKAPLRWVYAPYLHHILPRLAGWITGEADAYRYLGKSIEIFPQAASLCECMESVGFNDTQFEPLSGGIVTLYKAQRTRH